MGYARGDTDRTGRRVIPVSTGLGIWERVSGDRDDDGTVSESGRTTRACLGVRIYLDCDMGFGGAVGHITIQCKEQSTQGGIK